IDEFLSGQVDDVFIAYTDFINTLTQKPVVMGWLPLVPHEMEDTVAGEYLKSVPGVSTTGLTYDYEPDPIAILDEIVPRFTELQLYQAVLESAASEHSARMVAMRNASDNALQLAADYTLIYNKARQAAITNEILDIVGGAEALQSSIDKLAEQLLLQHQHDMLEVPSAPKKPAVTKVVVKGSKADDLTKIEGIGPKMFAALVGAGIDTFAKLAATDENTLRAAIEAAGMKFSPTLSTWSQQAAYAVNGDWAGLEAFQSQLVSGRKA
ncbi:MAG: F0F1 ATP synthase subunit gamma, partial [Anaerolineae bacterium]|nr:F0F1 ATP synthase subunit gamma [Anaerolineae bacterium]